MENTSDSSKEPGSMSGRMELEIYYEDTDLSGFVYHANYLKYFERAREHIIGVQYLKRLYDQDIHFVVSKANLSFLAPAMHADALMIESTAKYGRSPAIPFIQKAFKKGPQGHTLLAVGEITIVALNKLHRPIRIPDDVIDYFNTRN